jgi:hypothetical protein
MKTKVLIVLALLFVPGAVAIFAAATIAPMLRRFLKRIKTKECRA